VSRNLEVVTVEEPTQSKIGLEWATRHVRLAFKPELTPSAMPA